MNKKGANSFRIVRLPSVRMKNLDEKGSAMVMAAIFMLLAVTMITVGLKMTSNSALQAKANQTNVAEAENAARAGLEDALGWFIAHNGSVNYYNDALPGQTPIPNGSYTYADEPFNPQYNSNPVQSETIDQSIGIVNEYGLDNSDLLEATYIARYEVCKAPDPNATPVQTPPPYGWVTDISGERAVSEVNGDGTVWKIVSTGYIYERMDHTLAAGTTYTTGICPQWAIKYNSAPNFVLSKVTVSTEFRQVAYNAPTTSTSTATGAVYADHTYDLNIQSGGYVSGSSANSSYYGIVSMNSN